MSNIQTNPPIYGFQTGTPLYNYANTSLPQAQQQTVSVSTPLNSQVYQYPQTSLYGEPSKQAASGVNIYIYNPSGIGGPSSNSNANATYTLPPVTNEITSQVPVSNVVDQSSPIANTPISESTNENIEDKTSKKTKNVVALSDDYIKTLESYLRSQDKEVRKTGITQLIHRFEEDDSRYEHPALTALLNIALQDPDSHNRLLSIAPIASGSAHGDENTLEFLKKLTTSDKEFGQEAKMATSALLKAAETKITVPDNSSDKQKK